MGSEQSKGTSPREASAASPQQQHSVNVMITSEVSERWAALAREGWERKQGENEKIEMKEVKPSLKEKGEAGESGETEIGGISKRKWMSEPDAGVKVKDKALFEESAAPSSEAIGSSKNEENLATGAELSRAEVVADIKGGNEDPSDKLSEKMSKFANLLARKSALELRDDIENGVSSIDNKENYATTAAQYFVPSSHKLPLPISDEYQLPAYEEVNEIFNMKRDPKLHEMDKGGECEEEKENTMITNLQAEEPMKLKAIRIPKAILPVVIDDGENGGTTVQTITAWRHKERFQEELAKSDARWAEELRKLSMKFENNTVNYAQDLERRIRELGVKYPDIVVAASVNGAPCNELTIQIGKCYEKNKNQRLNCHTLIRQFAQCTNKSIKDNFTKG